MTLTYPYEEYYKHPKFTEFYENIRFLLTQKDIVIFGHSASNDINFLFKDCRRYELDLFDFIVYDTQKIYRELSKSNPKQTALEIAYNDLVDEETRNKLKDHRASDDSLKTMYILKGIAELLNFSINELIEACPNSKIDAKPYFLAARDRAKLRNKRKYGISPKQKQINAAGEKKWKELVAKHEPLLNEESSIGKFVRISLEIKHDRKLIDVVINAIEEKGYVAIDSYSGLDYLIVYNDAEGKEIKDHFKYRFKGKIITYQEFLAL